MDKMKTQLYKISQFLKYYILKSFTTIREFIKEKVRQFLEFYDEVQDFASMDFLPPKIKPPPNETNNEIVLKSRESSPLQSRVALFNTLVDKHSKKQAVNPFSNDQCVSTLPKPKYSKEDYGRPEKGSLSEQRAFKATIQVCKEMLQLCEVINQCGEPLFQPHEKQNDPRKVISFGNLFHIYTAISDKVVGMLIRARKHQLVDFEGECLFQRRDDHVPIILLKPYPEIYKILMEKIQTASEQLKESIEVYGDLDTNSYGAY